MAITTKIISALDIVLSQIGGDFLKKDLEDYCFIESVTGKDAETYDANFVANDGSFVSLINLNGLKMVVEEEIDDFVEILYKKLKPFFKEKGHSLQVCFTKDPERTIDKLNELVSPYKNEAKKMQMNADFIFDGKVKYLEKFTCYEENILVLWSRPSLISDNIKGESVEISNELAKYPIFEKGQQFLSQYKSLKDKHVSYVKTMITTFNALGFSVNLLDTNEQANKIKRSISTELTAHDWKPRTPIDKKPVLRENDKDINIKENDISYLMYPNLKQQFIPSDIELEDNVIKIGNKLVESIFIDIPQEEPVNFNEFFKSLDSDIPFQMSFKIDGGGLSNVGLKKLLASITSFHGGNRLIRESIMYYEDRAIEGEAITKNNITLNTWAYDNETLNKRKNFLLKSLQSWGSTTPRFNYDDKYEAFFSTIPAFTPIMSGKSFLDTLDAVLYSMPLSRQAHIWEYGCVLDRTKDGKIMPYQPASSLQPSWNELTFAKPGFGKSVRSNYVNWSFCVSPKAHSLSSGQLPYLGIIDIGISSLGLIKLLRTVLPETKMDQIIYHKLSNSIEDSINIFDTQLGCRKPNEKEREFIVNFISLLLTPSGGETPEGIDSMINNIVLEIYKEYSDEVSPKEYEEHELPEVDKQLRILNIDPSNRTWWWVVDRLFEKKEYKIAKLAQSRAVPLLEDTTKTANKTENIKNMYSKPKNGKTQENYLEYFNRTVSEVVNMYPLLNNPTRLDLSEARVISLDLNEVAKDGDAAAQKKAGIMYMLARFTVTRNFFVDKNAYVFAPELYKDYLIEKIKESQATPKRLCVDEFHRTSNIPIFRNQIKQDMREGRKWGLSISLISQLLDDFDKDMIELCNTKYVISGGDNYKEVQERLDLTNEIAQIVRTELNGPTHEGVPFIVKHTTKAGEFTQFLYGTMAPIEMWAFTSTMEDLNMIEQAELIFGEDKALRILSDAFPQGSIKKKVEQMTTSEKYRHIKDPISHIVEQLRKKYSKYVTI
jgi:intracellular multiplication protein IcmB